LVVLVVLAAFVGLAAGIINPIIGVLQLQLAPPAMRARVHSLMVAGCWAGIPIGALLGGIAVETLGLTASFVIVGVVYVLVSLAPLTGGAWKGMGPFRPDAR
ncbi:MFS transporter, partial [Cryobacterium roopkundense]